MKEQYLSFTLARGKKKKMTTRNKEMKLTKYVLITSLFFFLCSHCRQTYGDIVTNLLVSKTRKHVLELDRANDFCSAQDHLWEGKCRGLGRKALPERYYSEKPPWLQIWALCDPNP